jgi:hypothetical protein
MQPFGGVTVGFSCGGRFIMFDTTLGHLLLLLAARSRRLLDDNDDNLLMSDASAAAIRFLHISFCARRIVSPETDNPE